MRDIRENATIFIFFLSLFRFVNYVLVRVRIADVTSNDFLSVSLFVSVFTATRILLIGSCLFIYFIIIIVYRIYAIYIPLFEIFSMYLNLRISYIVVLACYILSFPFPFRSYSSLCTYDATYLYFPGFVSLHFVGRIRKY